jgi:serine/threonine protein phosphatase PrpC
MVDDSVIQQTLYAPATLEEKVENLIELALLAGGTDSITVVLVETSKAKNLFGPSSLRLQITTK